LVNRIEEGERDYRSPSFVGSPHWELAVARSPKDRVALDVIRAELRSAAEKFLHEVRREHPGETLYGFLFEVSCEGFSAHGTAASEEGLTRYAERWVADKGGKLNKLKAEFRWGSPEDAWYQEPDAVFDRVNRLLGEAEKQELYEMYDSTLNAICIQVLKQMDADGVFGVGPERERMVIGVCYIGGDNSEKEFLGWAKQVNPASVYKRLQQELRSET
jgi:hypothetical protein